MAKIMTIGVYGAFCDRKYVEMYRNDVNIKNSEKFY